VDIDPGRKRENYDDFAARTGKITLGAHRIIPLLQHAADGAGEGFRAIRGRCNDDDRRLSLPDVVL
jgi:hypothetical protein